jgi:N-acyl-D-aspartate/D-glutamate deacylase
MCADIVVFNPATVAETSTYKDPHRFPEGIEHVIVNGKITIESGRYTGALAGKTLRKR